jgi:hypothetical protein
MSSVREFLDDALIGSIVLIGFLFEISALIYYLFLLTELIYSAFN